MAAADQPLCLIAKYVEVTPDLCGEEHFTESGRIQGAVVSFLKSQQVRAFSGITAQDLLSYDGLKCVTSGSLTPRTKDQLDLISQENT